MWHPPPHEPEIWDNQHVNDKIERTIEHFLLEKSFRNLRINEMVCLIDKTRYQNLLSYNIAHEIITCEDRDSPWLNNKIKQLIREKNGTYRSYV